MKVLMSWSSGKDSAWALQTLRQQGQPVGALLTSINEVAGRVSMHGVREEILRAQADAAGLPLITVPRPWPCTHEIYEARLRVAVDRAVVDGACRRRYRSSRIVSSAVTVPATSRQLIVPV